MNITITPATPSDVTITRRLTDRSKRIYLEVAKSTVVEVQAAAPAPPPPVEPPSPPTVPTLTVTPTTLMAGDILMAAWAGIAAPTATDWLGLRTPGAAEDDFALGTWVFTNGAAVGTCPFVVPATVPPGNYEVRLYAGGGTTRLATSNLVTVAPAPVPVPVPWEPSMAYKYQPFFDQQYLNHAGTFDAFAASNWGQNYYTFQYALMGTLSMFEATRELNYLDRVLTWVETMIAQAQITGPGGYKWWAGTWFGPVSGVGVASQLEDFQAGTELARLARIILLDQQLAATHGTRATAVKNFVRQHIVDKHMIQIGSGPVYDGEAANVNVLYSDTLSMATRMITDLLAVGETQYQTRVTNWQQGLRNRFNAFSGDPDCFIWDVGIVSFNPNGIWDTSHANRHAAQMAHAVEHKAIFASADVFGTVLSIGNLFHQVMWNQSTSDPRFTNFINGSNADYQGGGPWTNGTVYAGWSWLGQYHTGCQTALEALLDKMILGTDFPAFNNSEWGRTCLSGVLTRNQASRLLTRRRELASERGVTRGVTYFA